MNVADVLAASIDRVGSPVCVGLDPVLEQLPPACRTGVNAPEAIAAFGIGVIDAVADAAAAIKVQSACYERYGSAGVAALERTVAHARARGLFVILDAKRGDIGISASHYAAAARHTAAHCVTVNGYLGMSGVQPFLDADLGVFVLVRTSNPDSDSVQSVLTGSGITFATHVAGLVASLGRSSVGATGLSAVGAVVGATKSADGLALRAAMPNQVFLIPGYGSQGGTADDIRTLVRPVRTRGRMSDAGVLVTASRSIIFAKPNESEGWQDAVCRAAHQMNSELRAVCA